MRPAHVIEIITPKKFLLNGLWFGPSTQSGKPKKPKRAIIWVHGLSSSAFSKLSIVEKLVDKDTAVITFNNRGHDTVAKLYQKNRRMTAGGGAEVFTDCVDDIEGAIRFVRRMGAKEVYLAGHSTGCQKTVYWAYKKGKGVKGAILLAPLSDWPGAVRTKKERIRVYTAVAAAKKFVRAYKPHTFLPDVLWAHPITAQRFLSLYTPDSVEQSIFSYFDSRRPRALSSLHTPLLVLLAEEDEYADRPVREIARWFIAHTHSRCTLKIVPKVNHSFRGGEAIVASHIRRWLETL